VTRLSVPLAVEDFVPVAVSAAGFAFVARALRTVDPAAGRQGAIGAALIVSGGLSRATWKLVYAMGGPDLGWLHAALYPLLAAGFALLALALWGARHAWADGSAGGAVRKGATHPGRSSRSWWPVPALLAALVAVTVLLGPGSGRLVPLLWLATATIGTGAMALLLGRWARALGRPRLGWAFVGYLVITITLNGLARPAEQTEALQWAQQLVNTANSVLFAFAAHRLAAAARRAAAMKPGADVSPAPEGVTA
jgi:hypothetical protein